MNCGFELGFIGGFVFILACGMLPIDDIRRALTTLWRIDCHAGGGGPNVSVVGRGRRCEWLVTKTESGSGSGTTASSAHRILVIDDSRDARDTLVMVLEMSGHQMRAAGSGLEALAVCAVWQPDLAFVDIGMPDMNGYELAERIRRESWGAAIVLVALTGWGDPDHIRQARAAGFDHHLTKPVDLQTLETLIERTLNATHRS